MDRNRPHSNWARMEIKMKAELGHDLYNIRDAGDLPAVLAYLSRQSSRDPTFEPPLAAMMYVSTRRDHHSIVQHCLASGGKVLDNLLELCGLIIRFPISRKSATREYLKMLIELSREDMVVTFERTSLESKTPRAMALVDGP
ncbi:MAG: hypothetical protein Q9161_003659 [Pseudevernia consocians]